MTFFGRRPHTDSRRKVDVKCVHLYIDDSGSRRPDRTERSARKDGMHYFALGGILINEEDIAGLLEVHRRFLAKWKIDGPLHSTRIRGRRGEFSWLGTDPAKYARRCGARLKLYFEQAGKKEDRAILAYARSLESEGMPFDADSSGVYSRLNPSDFRELIISQPNRITKKVPMAQIADLVLYPMAKGGYDPNYRPYRRLIEASRLMDALLEPEEHPTLGVKYSCFDAKK